ncbi:MAG: hypothetical protein HZA61_12740 [Candidatus Eisenbacteria bacterium]|uniref:Glycine zipper 2TM domain-containing protein n=1 Tax=Eiseniibacteriota bacterium TaxID=2212470 RepID=A0A933SHC3_UNCEI|nr:hypothetical protein [Candidatus Eisenbacteria bacterium]
MKRLMLTLVLAAVLVMVAAPREARAENSFNEVAKTTVLGAAAGLVVGGAIAWLAEDGEPVKWGFVVGTFGGLAYGLAHQNSSSASLIELRRGTIGTGGLASVDRRNGSVQVRAIGLRF